MCKSHILRVSWRDPCNLFPQYLTPRNHGVAADWKTHLTSWWFQPTPLKNDGVRQLGWWISMKLNGKNKIHVPNHQSVEIIWELEGCLTLDGIGNKRCHNHLLLYITPKFHTVTRNVYQYTMLQHIDRIVYEDCSISAPGSWDASYSFFNPQKITNIYHIIFWDFQAQSQHQLG